jgi:tetratricopeptide (TPR) repeat protein
MKIFTITTIILLTYSLYLHTEELNKYIELKQYENAVKYIETKNITDKEKATYFIRLGLHFFENNKVNQAKKYFMQASLLDTTNYTSFLHLGIISYNENNYNRALHEFNKCIELNKQTYIPHYYLGIIHNKQGNLNEAEKHFLQAYNLSPDNHQILLSLLEFYHQIRNLNRYIEYANIYINLKDVSENQKIIIIKNVLEFYSNISNHNLLLEFFNSLPEPFQKNNSIKLTMGETFFLNNNYNKAKEFLKSIDNTDTSYNIKDKFLGDIYHNEENYSTSLEHYKKYLSTNPADKNILIKLLDIYINLKNFENFENCFNALLNNFELSEIDENIIFVGINFLLKNQQNNFLNDVFNILGHNFYSNETFLELKINYLKNNLLLSELIILFNEIKNNLTNEELKTEYKNLLLYTGNFSELNNFLQETGLSLTENESAEINKINGYLYYIDEKYDSALKYWNKYLEKFPQTKNINYFISTIYRKKNDLRTERTFLLNEYENNPYNYLNLKRIINNSLALGDIKNAELYALSMLSFDTELEFPKQILIEKEFYSNEQRLFQAINTFKNSINLRYSKEYLEKTFLHSIEEIKNKKYQNGIEYLKRSLFVPENKLSEYYFYKGEANLNLHKYIYGYIYFNLSNLYDKNIPALYNLVLINKELNNYSDALDIINTIKSLSPETDNWINLKLSEAIILYNNKNYNKAMLHFLTLQKFGHESANDYLFKINFKLAKHNYNAGNYHLALTFYEACLNYEIMPGLIFFEIGNTYFKDKNFVMAQQNYNKALYYNYTEPALYNNLGLVHTILKNNIEAKRLFSLAGKEVINIDETNLIDFKNMLNNNNFKKASEIINNIENKEEQKLLKIFLNKIQNQRVDLSIINNINSNKIISKDIYYFIKSLYFINNNNILESKQHFTNAFLLSNFSRYYLTELIKTLNRNNVDITSSINYINDIADKTKYDNKCFINFLIGNLYFYDENYLRAYQFYKKAISLNENFIPAQNNLILTLYQLKKFDNSLNELNNFGLETKNAHLFLMLLYQKKGLYSLAYNEYLKYNN